MEKNEVLRIVESRRDERREDIRLRFIVQSVITGNPFGCVSYMSAGATHGPVENAIQTAKQFVSS